MAYFTILFDFDGTLADTQELAFDILNSVAPEFGIRPITREEIPALKKMSAWQLLRQRSGIPLWNVFKIRRLERRVRAEFLNRADDIHLFSGIPEMMRNARAAGYELGVVSSNAPGIVREVLAREGVEVNFVHAGSRFFGKAGAIRAACAAYDVDRSHAVYVGDELRDIAACKKARIDMVAVGWGFNAADALQGAGAKVAKTPQELLGILGTP